MTTLVFTLQPSGAKLQLDSGLGGGSWKETTASDCFPIPNGGVKDELGSLLCFAGGDRVLKLTAARWSGGPRSGNAILNIYKDTTPEQTWTLA